VRDTARGWLVAGIEPVCSLEGVGKPEKFPENFSCNAILFDVHWQRDNEETQRFDLQDGPPTEVVAIDRFACAARSSGDCAKDG
jgi:hypothetical protein